MAPAKPAPSDDADEPPIQQRIMAVATDLFVRAGYNGISFLDIARELGISHSHIHYYFRTKAVLAEAVLQNYVAATTADFQAIWTRPDSDLLTRFVASRDWIYHRYLAFNPAGKGRQNWGLLARFAGEAESMSPAIRKMLADTLNDMDSFVAAGIRLAVETGELSADTPQPALVLQISSLLHTSRNITRFEGSFQRLDELLQWTYEVIQRAYGTGRAGRPWPPIIDR